MPDDFHAAGNEARVRRAGAEDAPAILRLVHAVIDACYPAAYPPNAVARFKELHTEAQVAEDARTGITLVAEAGGRAAGTGTVVGTHLKRVFVDPDFQGRGVGRAIVERLEAEARSGGAGELRLEVSIPSRRFWEALGFSDFEDASWDVGGGQRLDFWTARKKL